MIFDVDVIGGLNLKKEYGDKAIAIYVDTPDFDKLEQRLRLRATETEEKIQQRLLKARSEQQFKHKFDELLVNEHLDETLEKSEDLIRKFVSSK